MPGPSVARDGKSPLSSPTGSSRPVSQQVLIGSRFLERNFSHSLMNFYQALVKSYDEGELKDGVRVDHVIKELLYIRRRDQYFFRLFGHIVYFLLFASVIATMREPLSAAYEMRTGMYNVFVKEEFPVEYSHIYKNWNDVQTPGEFWQWVKSSFLNALFDVQTASQGSQLVMQNSILLGPPRIRQIRVDPSPCKINASQQCFLGLDSQSHVSETPFGSNSGERFKWSKNEQGTSFRSYTTGFLYPASGFNIDLNISQGYSATREYLNNLEQEGFIDPATRAIFVNVNVYNPSTNIWVAFQLLAEFTSVGAIEVRSLYIKPINVATGPVGKNIFVSLILPIWLSLWVILGFGLYFRELWIQHKYLHKAMNYALRPWNIMELGSLLLATILLCIWAAFVADPQRKEILKETHEALDNFSVLNYSTNSLGTLLQAGSSYTYLESLVIDYWAPMIQLGAFNFLFATFTTFKYVEVSTRLGLIWAALSHAASDLFAFIILLSTVMYGCAVSSQQLYGADLFAYRRLNVSFATAFRNLLGELNFDKMDQIWSTSTPIYFYGFVILMILILVNIFIAIIDSAFADVANLLPPDDNFSRKTSKYMDITLSYCKFVFFKVRRVFRRSRGSSSINSPRNNRSGASENNSIQSLEGESEVQSFHILDQESSPGDVKSASEMRKTAKDDRAKVFPMDMIKELEPHRQFKVITAEKLLRVFEAEGSGNLFDDFATPPMFEPMASKPRSGALLSPQRSLRRGSAAIIRADRAISSGVRRGSVVASASLELGSTVSGQASQAARQNQGSAREQDFAERLQKLEKHLSAFISQANSDSHRQSSAEADSAKEILKLESSGASSSYTISQAHGRGSNEDSPQVEKERRGEEESSVTLDDAAYSDEEVASEGSNGKSNWSACV